MLLVVLSCCVVGVCEVVIFCLICDKCRLMCSFWGSMCGSSCKRLLLVSVLRPVEILGAVFCVMFNCVLMCVVDA